MNSKFVHPFFRKIHEYKFCSLGLKNVHRLKIGSQIQITLCNSKMFPLTNFVHKFRKCSYFMNTSGIVKNVRGCKFWSEIKKCLSLKKCSGISKNVSGFKFFLDIS